MGNGTVINGRDNRILMTRTLKGNGVEVNVKIIPHMEIDPKVEEGVEAVRPLNMGTNRTIYGIVDRKRKEAKVSICNAVRKHHTSQLEREISENRE